MPGSKQRKRKSIGQLSTVYPLAAGIDVGATAHVVAVPAERDERPVRTFRTFSADLHRLADWLAEVGITTIAMESTGVYWIPVFEILEAHGFQYTPVASIATCVHPPRSSHSASSKRPLLNLGWVWWVR